MKCHLQFTSTAVTWQIRITPGLQWLTQGGCYFEGGFGKGGKCTKASKHDIPIPRAWGLCLPWVLLPGEVAQPPLPAQGTWGVSAETWQSNTPFLRGLAPEISLDFIFPLLSSYIYIPHVSHGLLAESCCLPPPPPPAKAWRCGSDPLFHPPTVTCLLSPSLPLPNF